jgi:hypothetical protein
MLMAIAADMVMVAVKLWSSPQLSSKLLFISQVHLLFGHFSMNLLIRLKSSSNISQNPLNQTNRYHRRLEVFNSVVGLRSSSLMFTVCVWKMKLKKQFKKI